MKRDHDHPAGRGPRPAPVTEACSGRSLWPGCRAAAGSGNGRKRVLHGAGFALLVGMLALLWPAGMPAAGFASVPELLSLSETVAVTTRTPRRGEAVVLVMRAAAAGVPQAVVFFDRRYSVAAVGDRFVAVCPVPLTAGPGPRELQVLRERGGERLNLEVLPADYGEERLELPPEMVTPTRPEHLERIRRDRRRLAAAYGASADRVLFPTPFVRPLEGELITPFGKRRILNGIPKQPHGGIDIRGASGTPVCTSAAGRVVLAEELYYSGRAVIIDHGLEVFSLYLHLDELAVVAGDEVGRGQFIGRVGSTGRVTGPHLHWGVKIAGVFVDPLRFVAASRFLAADE